MRYALLALACVLLAVGCGGSSDSSSAVTSCDVQIQDPASQPDI